MKAFSLTLPPLLFAVCVFGQQPSGQNPMFQPFIWKSETPADCPFGLSGEITGIEFLGIHTDYRFADTWYPSWSADGNLYSPWTDGDVYGEGSSSDAIAPDANSFGGFGLVTGNFAPDWNGEKIKANPPGTRYDLTLQKIRLLGPAAR
jgi:hypothetical protein